MRSSALPSLESRILCHPPAQPPFLAPETMLSELLGHLTVSWGATHFSLNTHRVIVWVRGPGTFCPFFFIEPSNSPWNFHFSILTVVSLCQQDRGPFQQACFQKECVIMLSPSSDYRHLAIKTHPATCWRGWGPEHGATAPKMQTHSLSYP